MIIEAISGHPGFRSLTRARTQENIRELVYVWFCTFVYEGKTIETKAHKNPWRAVKEMIDYEK